MKAGEFPWLPLYVSDWLSSSTVTCMSLASQGAFVRLLCHQWKTEFIPDDEVMIAKLLIATPEEFKAVWCDLEPVFPVIGDGRRQNTRLETERAKRQGRSKSAAESAGRRWANQESKGTPAPKPKRAATPKAKAETPPKDPDPNKPYARIERILTAVSVALNGSEVQKADIVRHLRPGSHINLLLEQFSEEEVVALYVYAAKNWSAGASWAGVHSQRDSLRASMARPAKRSGKETAAEKYDRLQGAA